LTRVYTQADPDIAPVYLTSIMAHTIEPHGLWPSPDNSHLYILGEHSDAVDVVDLSTMKVTKTLNIGQEGQAIVYVAGAVPEGRGNGTQNLSNQGLMKEPPLNRLLSAKTLENGKAATALVTVRRETGLDMFQVIGRNLKLNTTYAVTGSCLQCNGSAVPLVEFSAVTPSGPGCGTAPQVLAFFKFHGVYSIDSLQLEEV
jgi:YVTN family beta-propeller protein